MADDFVRRTGGPDWVPYWAAARDRELRFQRCRDCGAAVFIPQPVCTGCFGNTLEWVTSSGRGTVYSYTVVHRSFPGVKTPFVAAIVNLDGGGTLKGTLMDVAPDPHALPYDMPVRVVYRDSGQKAADGSPFLTYCFVPSHGDRT